MVQQTIQFETVSPSEIGSGTITAFLYSGDTLAATLANITENSTLKGRHTGTVDDEAAAEYRLVVKFDGYTISEPDETVTLLLAVGTYVSKRLAVLDSDAQAMVAAFNAMRSGNVFIEEALANAPSGSGGDATAENQEEIKALITGSAVIQVGSPNVSRNLVLTQGDDYDGVANPRASWTVSTDYTSGWTVRLTIRNVDDVVIYSTTGSVVSATVVAVTIAAPTGLTMTGCPGQWQGKFDVELTNGSGKKKTIALGMCYINEDQTR